MLDRRQLVGVPALDTRLRSLLDDLDVRLLPESAVTSVSGELRQMTVTRSGHATETLRFDMLHLVPPFRGPEWVTSSGLDAADTHGLVDVDPFTFRHRAHPEVGGG